MVGAWGPATTTGGLVQLRALDWDTDGPFQAFPMVLIRHPSDLPDGGHAFLTVGYAAEVGAITGYSSTDVGISEKVWIHYDGASSWTGAPTTFVLRDILQFGSDLKTSIAGVLDSNRTNSIFTGIGAKKDGQFRVLEYAHDNVTVWSDQNGPDYGNHTRRPGLVYLDKHAQPDPGPGAWCLDKLINLQYGKIDALSLLQEIVPRYQTGDSQVAVYDFDARMMWVAFPSVSGWPKTLNVRKAYDRPLSRLNLTHLFGEPREWRVSDLGH